MNAIDLIIQGDYFKLKEILKEPWVDVRDYLLYLTDKLEAKAFQDKFTENINKRK